MTDEKQWNRKLKRDELNTENKLNDDKIWKEILNSLFPNSEANMKICMKKGKFLHVQYKNNIKYTTQS